MDIDERPFVLIWELTQACDLACEHCRADAQPDRHPDELSTEAAERLLDETREFGENQLVVFSGGDPLKRDDTVDFVEYSTDIGLSVTTTKRDCPDSSPTGWPASDWSSASNEFRPSRSPPTRTLSSVELPRWRRRLLGR